MDDSRESPQTSMPGSAGARGGATQDARTVFTLSEDETFDLGRTLARGLRGGELVLLEGDLGLGKTVFARGIAVGLGIPAEDVSSPSFTLIQEYRGGRLLMYHVDLYRLSSEEETRTLGLEDILSTEAVVVVERGEKLPSYQRRGAIVARFHDVGEGSRRIEIVGRGNDPPTRRGDA